MLLPREKVLELIRWQPDPIDLEQLFHRLRGLASAPAPARPRDNPAIRPESPPAKNKVRPIADELVKELTECLATAADRVELAELDRWERRVSQQIRWVLASDKDRDDKIATAIGPVLGEERTGANQGYLDRLQRARSWFAAGMLYRDDVDLAFACYWIGLNALFGGFPKPEADPRTSAPSPRSLQFVDDELRGFCAHICQLDTNRLIPAALVDIHLMGDVKLVLKDRHHFKPHYKGKDRGEVDKLLSRVDRDASSVLRQGRYGDWLSILLGRIQDIRNHIFHGSATYRISKNRASILPAVTVLTALAPILVGIMEQRTARAAPWPPIEKPREGSPSNSHSETSSRRTRMPHIVAFVRGLSMFAHRRVLKVQQVGLLRQHLPTTIKLLGAFDDSGNYALDSRDPESAVGPAILAALRREDRLRDLGEVSVAPEPVVRSALDELVTRLRLEYGNDWNASTYGVRREGTLWRAGLAFGSDGEALELPESGPGGTPNVIIISRREGIVAFLKRENSKGETRISFGDPTRMVDQASRVHLGRRIATTSRSARTVAGVLRCF